jgi:hypothetical protein
MDLLGMALADAVRSRDWAKGSLNGFQDATRIAERVRISMGLAQSDVSGEPASRYLAEVLSKVGQHAEAEAAKSYGRYRWLWYLRRLPDAVFEGNIATTGPYDRCLTEVLATRGAGPTHALGRPSDDGTFPIDGTVIKRLAWIRGFSLAFAQHQVDFRIVGKGGVLAFNQSLPGLPFPVSLTRRDDVLDIQIAEYDRRNEHQKVFTKAGVPIDADDPKSHDCKQEFLLLAKVAGPPPIVTPSQLDIPQAVAMRYRPFMLPVRELESLLTHPLVAASVNWSPELPLLLTLLYLTIIIWARVKFSRSQLLQTGYMLVMKHDLDDLYSQSYPVLREMMPLLRAFPEPSSDAAFSDKLLQIEGRPSPLLGGPVAFIASNTRMGIDICNATRRVLDLLEFPRVHGKPANVRARAFEEKVQKVIDGTPWAPPDSIRRLIGHHFKKDGKWIGEVDAFGSSDRTLLLVSCKSVVYTTDYDRGEYTAVRNARTILEKAVERFTELATHFAQFPDGGSEYDFTAYDTIAIVVVTPHVMYVTEPLLSQFSLPGLRSYSGFEEFRRWLRHGAYLYS